MMQLVALAELLTTLPVLPMCMLRCEVLCDLHWNLKFKSSHILEKILLLVNALPLGGRGAHGSCLAHAAH